MKFTVTSILLVPCFFSTVLNAQEPAELTLEKCIALAFQQSYPMQNTIQQYLSAKKNFEAQVLNTATTVDLTFSLPDYSESLTSQFNSTTNLNEFYQLQTNYLRSDLAINQPIALTGGTVSLSGDFFKRNQISGESGSSEQINDYFSSFQVQLRQPLFYPNILKINRDQASLRLDQTFSSFQRDQLDVIYNVTNAFYTAYQLAEQEHISSDQVKQNQDSYETAKNKFSAGLIPEVDLLQSEVDLVTSQNQRLNDQRESARAKNALKIMLGLPLDHDITLSADLRFTHIAVDETTAVAKALQNRAELLNALRARDVSRMDVDIASSQRHVRFDVTASYGLNKNDTELESTFRQFDRSRAVALQVTVPVFDWGRHSRQVEAAEAQMKSAELTYVYTGQQIKQEILDLLSQINAAESRIQVLAKSIEVAQKSYDITLERFRVGTATRNDLSQAQQRLTTSKLNNLVALIDYRMGLADLTRKTLWNFEKNQPAEIVIPAD
ncbi:MAG: TolC family protein [Bacteroidota bacterium]